MLRILRNGRSASVDARHFASVGEALASCTDAGDALVRLCIDGREIDHEQWGEVAARAPDGLHEIEIEAVPVEELMHRSLRHALEYAPRVSDAAGRVADLLRQGELQRALDLHASLLDALSVLCFAAAAGQGPHPASAALEAELVPWLGELESVQRREDWLYMADLLEHEIGQRVRAWAESLAATSAEAAP